MADKSKIEWTDATWNPLRGCSRVSEGCRHCYAEGVAARFSGPGLPYEGLAKWVTVGSGPLAEQRGRREPRWTGKVAFSGDEVLTQPLRWKKPRKIFVNSMSDLFHEDVPDEWIDRIFAVMALAPQHTFQVLTKRPKRMRIYLQAAHRQMDVANEIAALDLSTRAAAWTYRADHFGVTVPHYLWPLPNVWLGTSVEDQVTADTRIPYLLSTPAAVRFISAEPLLGPIDLGGLEVSALERQDVLQGKLHGLTTSGSCCWTKVGVPHLDWVIVGGESGAGARPMHPDWARSLRDQCAAAGVAFFFKQWGEHEADQIGPEDARSVDYPPGHVIYRRVGKHAAGRLLDGIEHDGMPEVRHG